ncbi:hypothetical protein HJC23_008746 [Cyclotella cryptica]|uniref:Uncharacterized protein n=1 Tax=Cyclotella cryptica TaxID=29204 RepID=A0ABD3PCP2_9STRA|eukprot:CCRYP_015656-RA/>CCRYP_015656-RA protein AED:0.09 eAED:0.09 QI:281/1/1/1/1/1/2/3164/1072
MYRQALLQPRRRLLATLSHDGITHRPSPRLPIPPILTLRNRASEAASTSPRRFSPHDNGNGAPRNNERREKSGVPRYLIPQAYRRRIPEDAVNNHYKSKHPRKDGPPSSSKPIARRSFQSHRNHKDKARASFRANSPSSIKRQRRKQARSLPQHSTMEQRRFMRRHSKFTMSQGYTYGGVDFNSEIKAMERIEGELSRKLNEYNSRLMGSLNFGEVAKEIGEREEKEREFVPSLFSILDGKKDAQHQQEKEAAISDALNGNAPSIADLYATEESYANIASDFRSLILGLVRVAESICNDKWVENSQRNDGSGHDYGKPDKQEDGVRLKDYESAVLKAEHYLEVFETFHRRRLQVVEKGRMKLEEAMRKMEGEKNPKVLQEVGSFLRDVFANPLSRSNTYGSDFDELWKRADGSKYTTNDVTGLGEVTPSNFDDLIRSHKIVDLCPDIALYEHLISANHAAYCFGNQAKLEATERSNRLLTRWISLHCLQTKNDGVSGGGEVNSSSTQHQLPVSSQDDAKYPEQRLFHLVMRQNTDLWTKNGSQRVEEWLRRMESLQQAGHVHCGPDLLAYNLLLLSYCNLCKNMGIKLEASGGSSSKAKSQGGGTAHAANIHASTRTYILEGVEKILLELNNHDGLDANVLSLNLALNALAKAGKNEADLCQKTDRLLCKVLGEYNFNRIVDETDTTNTDKNADAVNDDKFDLVLNNMRNALVDASKSSIEPDLDTYHWLVEIYSASGNLFYIRRAMTLLNKMIRLRITIDSNSDGMNGDTMPPFTGTFNNALRALQCKVDELDRLSYSKNGELTLSSEQKQQRELQNFSPAEIAKSVTPLVDAMVQFDSSSPTRVTFLFVLQIWSKSGAVDAGDQAEEILSKMEVITTYQDMRPFSNAYKLVLHCWLASAKAGRPGSVERAHRLMEIIEAQAGEHATEILSNDITEGTDNIFSYFDIFDKTRHDYSKLYQIMLKICANTHRKEDTVHAVDIAFETYGKMKRHGVKPTAKTFALMYSTVQNFIYHHPDHPKDEKRRLLERVVDAARMHNMTKGELIGRWQQWQLREATGENVANNSDERDSV